MAPIRPRKGLDECHDAIEEDNTSSNTPPHKVGIENKLKHKEDGDIKIDMKGKDRLVEGSGRALGTRPRNI